MRRKLGGGAGWPRCRLSPRTEGLALLAAQVDADWESRFAAVVCAEDAPVKKPDPQAYRLVLERLQLRSEQTVAIEDSAMGLAAATAAGIPVVITRSRYFPDDPVPGALAVGPSLGSRAGWSPGLDGEPGRVELADLRHWHETRS